MGLPFDRSDVPMANGNGGLLNGHSDWTSLKAWSQAIGLVVIPGAACLWLVYIGSTELPRIVRQQEEIRIETKQVREQIAQLIQATNTLTRVSQRACSNAAKDDHARQRCFDP